MKVFQKAIKTDIEFFLVEGEFQVFADIIYPLQYDEVTGLINNLWGI